MKRLGTKILTVMLAIALLFTSASAQTLAATSKTTKSVSVTKVTITKPTTETLVLAIGDTYTLKTSVTPSNATNKKLKFSSSNTKVVSISTTGKIKAINTGSVTISVQATDGSNKKDTCIIKVNDGYELAWSDDFSGSTLNLKNWNIELHDPGWVNNELQAYTDSPDNIYVEDGKLVIKAIKSVVGDTTTFTSGRVTTENKQEFTYGRIKIKAKVPSGQGLWPAGWMLADSSIYGDWPRCGEIDIMEILGHQPNKLYGTLHYGDPHASQQGTYILNEGTFADDYHVYSVEWEPSEMRFYIDGILFHTVNDWYTKTDGLGEVTYPAPFDQPFFVILNLAVGGDWPGSPDETTDFENAKMLVDYVKVYQLKSYNENVTDPSSLITLREPDANGNYIINGDFSDVENLSDNTNWSLLTALGGTATANIAQNKLNIDTTAFGTVNYSVQFVQPKLPMKKGGNYRLTFDAKASADRKMIVNISAPDKNYIRYMPDADVELTTDLKSFTYDFSVTGDSDANGRLEFNLGAQDSLASVEISNVKLVKVSETEIVDTFTKTVLPNGNYVYNQGFQEGPDRMNFWEVTNKVKGAQISVTNSKNIRELKVVVPKTVSSISDIIVKQTDLALTANKNYTLSFEVYGAETKSIKVRIDGKTFKVTMKPTKQTFKYQFTTGSTVTSADLEFLLGKAGTTFIDNVKVTEAGMLINGDFANGFTGWETFIEGGISTKVSTSVDSVVENNAVVTAIEDTGDADWKIQLKQSNITLEKGKWYKLSLNAKSDLARKLKIILQKDGSTDNEWTTYGAKVVDLGSDYATYNVVFQMEYSTDAKTILSIAMGAVEGVQITEAHKICIDNVVLEETTDPSANLMKNGDFSQGQENWLTQAIDPSAATFSFTDNKAVVDITNVGDQDWNVQLKQSGLAFEEGKTYTVKVKLTSSVDRTVRLAYMSTTYDWYGGGDVALLAGQAKEVELTFTMSKPTDLAADFVISMGYIKDLAVNPGVVTIENVSIVQAGN